MRKKERISIWTKHWVVRVLEGWRGVAIDVLRERDIGNWWKAAIGSVLEMQNSEEPRGMEWIRREDGIQVTLVGEMIGELV